MMLNSLALTELLSKNTDQRLCKRWALITPNGTLVAYSKPTNIRDLRKQAATAALSWQEHSEQQSSAISPDTEEPRSPGSIAPSILRTLTLETDKSNVIIRKVQPKLLLVLEGGVPPRRRGFEHRVTAEGPGDAPYPAPEDCTAGSVPGSSASSVAESTRTTASLGILGMQRRKLDALASAIAQDFEKTGFRMPDEGSTKYF